MKFDHAAFRVRNIENSIAFYTEKIGFKYLFETDSEELNERYVFLDYNGTHLELIETVGRDYTPVKPESPYCPHICFETDDIDKEIEKLRSNGVEILDGPIEVPGEEAWFYFADPDENILEFIVWYEKK